MANKMKICLLVGDFENVGDQYIAESEAIYLQSIHKESTINIFTYSQPHNKAVEYFKQKGFNVSSMGKNPTKLFRNSLGTSLYIGGGQTIRDHVSYKYLLIIGIASLIARYTNGSSTIVASGCSQDIGPAKSIAWKAIFSLCKKISLRDDQSIEYFKKNFPTTSSPLFRTSDAAFLTNPKKYPSLQSKKILLVSIANDPSECRSLDTTAIIHAAKILHDAKRIDAVKLVCHDIRADFDVTISNEICSTICNTLNIKSEVVICNTPQELKDEYKNCSMALTSRLHGLILSIIYCKPVTVIFDSTNKLSEYCKDFGVANIQKTPTQQTPKNWESLRHQLLSQFDENHLLGRINQLKHHASLAKNNFSHQM